MVIFKKKRRVDERALNGSMVAMHIQRIDGSRAHAGEQAGQGCIRRRSMHLSGIICRAVAADVVVLACRERAQLMMPYLVPTRQRWWCGCRHARHVTLLRVPTWLIVGLIVTEMVVDVIGSEAGLLCLLWLSAAYHVAVGGTNSNRCLLILTLLLLLSPLQENLVVLVLIFWFGFQFKAIAMMAESTGDVINFKLIFPFDIVIFIIIVLLFGDNSIHTSARRPGSWSSLDRNSQPFFRLETRHLLHSSLDGAGILWMPVWRVRLTTARPFGHDHGG